MSSLWLLARRWTPRFGSHRPWVMSNSYPNIEHAFYLLSILLLPFSYISLFSLRITLYFAFISRRSYFFLSYLHLFLFFPFFLFYSSSVLMGRDKQTGPKNLGCISGRCKTFTSSAQLNALRLYWSHIQWVLGTFSAGAKVVSL